MIPILADMRPDRPARYVDPQTVSDATALRRALHRAPEISHHETGTARAITAFVGDYSPDEVIVHLGGTGVAVVYRGLEPGPTVLIRSELDALPIDEVNEFAHRSQHEHVSHKCGHDGQIRRAAEFLDLDARVLLEPIRWSEDFGLFTQVSTGAMLGLGSGAQQSALHSPDYDFPDALIPTGISLFARIIAQLLGPAAPAH